MTELIYLTDSYQKELKTRVVSAEKRGNLWEVVLSSTIFYPEGGGQPSDRGTIAGKNGKAHVKHVRMKGDTVVHECTLEGTLNPGDIVHCTIDWPMRYHNMRVHSAGHIVHEAVKIVSPALTPQKGSHGDEPYIEYEGSLAIDKKYLIEKEADMLVEKDLPLKTELVSLDELQRRSPWVPPHLPKNKPLRILTIGELAPIPDGGTQVHSTEEVGPITITKIDNSEDHVRVYYSIETMHQQESTDFPEASLPASALTGMLLDVQHDALEEIRSSTTGVEHLKLQLLGSKSPLSALTKQIRLVPPQDRQSVGIVVTQVKTAIESALATSSSSPDVRHSTPDQWFDVTMPGIRPPEGHLHIVTQAITEITRIFATIGFTRVRYPEMDWDYYAFESLNMPIHHPARDEWETFFIEYPGKPASAKATDGRRQKMVLTPHTSNGQVREMEKGKLPIRMINIAKCYRRQIDVSHTPMFHQFEGMYIDTNVSIGHLTGVCNYFAQQFFGPGRKIRLRPFHFQFTEPSFEVDINCGICLGSGKLKNGDPCRLCKAGWLELGGAGMVHPAVLRNGGIDPNLYSGFAFGWGIERTFMMKSGTQLDDIRLLYSNDMRFLEQF